MNPTEVFATILDIIPVHRRPMRMTQTKRLTSAPDSGGITRSILVLRGQRVLLDAELAALYGVETRTLIQAVQRNRARFPADFMFQLNAAEWLALRSQFVISKAGRGGRRYPPYAFTEQGVAMLSSRSSAANVPSPSISRSCVLSCVCANSLAQPRNSPGDLHNSKPGSTKNSPSTMRPSAPSSRRSAS
jgi:ORF6N domain